MQFELGLVFFSLVFIAAFVLGTFLVFRKSWLLIWLRANAGIGFLFFGLAGLAGLYLLTDMTSITGETRLGTVEVRPLGMNTRFAQLDLTSHGERDIELTYDQWRLRAMHIHWSGVLSLFGIDDGMMIYDLQESNGNGVVRHSVIEHEAVTKVWQLGHQYLNWLPGVEFTYITTEWQPSHEDGAYDLSVTNAGLRLKNRHQKARPNTAQILFENANENNDNTASASQSDVPSQQAEIIDEELHAQSKKTSAESSDARLMPESDTTESPALSDQE